jgi:hypothetical protein
MCTVTATDHAGSTAQTSHPFTVAPSTAQIAAGPRSQLAPDRTRARIAVLLKHGYGLNFRALRAGRVTIDWYYRRGGGQGSKPNAVLRGPASPLFEMTSFCHVRGKARFCTVSRTEHVSPCSSACLRLFLGVERHIGS